MSIPESTATTASHNTIITKSPNLSLNFSVAIEGSDVICFFLWNSGNTRSTTIDHTNTTGLSVGGTKNPMRAHHAAMKLETILSLSTVLKV
jgi:hypothetical protein